MSVKPLRFANEAFAVARQIEHCPPKMMLRELVMNAIEAAEKDVSGSGEVVIKPVVTSECPGITKLAIYNNGPGMSADELLKVCDLSSTHNKIVGLDGNFGIGAKVASLPSNKLGMRYWSCKGGRVSQVILCQDQDTGVYGVQELSDKTGWSSFTADVTIRASLEGYEISKDWTEVVLYGNTPEQNTVLNPFESKNLEEDETISQWIQRGINERFFRIPENVTLFFAAGTHTRGATKLKFKTLSDRIKMSYDKNLPANQQDGFYKQCRHECVEVGEGVKIHYIHDPLVKEPAGKTRNASYSGAPCYVSTFISMVYKGEFYELSAKDAWRHIAPKFGVPWGYKVLTILIEIPDNYGVMPDSYRENIRYANSKEVVKSLDFAGIVISNRPKWVLDVIDSMTPSGNNNDLRQELQNLLDESLMRSVSPTKKRDGEMSASEGNIGAAGRGDTSSGDHPNPDPKPSIKKGLRWDMSGTVIASNLDNRIKAPLIKPLYNEEAINEKDIQDRAGLYEETENVLYVNMKYSAVDQAFQHFLDKYATYPDQDTLQYYALQRAEELIQRLVGRALIYAKVKKLHPKTWSAADIERAMSPESLSLAADNWIISIQSCYINMSKLFKLTSENA